MNRQRLLIRGFLCGTLASLVLWLVLAGTILFFRRAEPDLFTFGRTSYLGDNVGRCGHSGFCHRVQICQVEISRRCERCCCGPPFRWVGQRVAHLQLRKCHRQGLVGGSICAPDSVASDTNTLAWIVFACRQWVVTWLCVCGDLVCDLLGSVRCNARQVDW